MSFSNYSFSPLKFLAGQLLKICLVGLSLANNVYAQSDFSVFEKSISDIQNALTEGKINSVELVDQYLARIAAYDKKGLG